MAPTSQSHGNRIVRRRPFGALTAEVATPPAAEEERDALAQRFVFTCLFARREVGVSNRRLAPVDLASARVAMDIGPELYPSVIYGDEHQYVWRLERKVVTMVTCLKCILSELGVRARVSICAFISLSLSLCVCVCVCVCVFIRRVGLRESCGAEVWC